MSSPSSMRASRQYALFGWLCSVILFFPLVHAVNVIIDDQNGDASTGAMPLYQPAGQWSFGPSCTDCRIKPNASQALDHSWHDTSVLTQQEAASMTLSFNGEYARYVCPARVALFTSCSYRYGHIPVLYSWRHHRWCHYQHEPRLLPGRKCRWYLQAWSLYRHGSSVQCDGLCPRWPEGWSAYHSCVSGTTLGHALRLRSLYVGFRPSVSELYR